MVEVVSVCTAKQELERLLAQLDVGETATITDSEGTPLAVLVSLRPGPRSQLVPDEWLRRWDALADDVTRAWVGDKSIQELLSEMRR